MPTGDGVLFETRQLLWTIVRIRFTTLVASNCAKIWDATRRRKRFAHRMPQRQRAMDRPADQAAGRHHLVLIRCS